MRLLIHFTDETLTDFRWALYDEAEGSAAFVWQFAGEDELAAVAAQNPHPVIVVIPQQCVYLTQVELPEKASRQLLGAIEYQVEDRLAQDVESQHFALGDTRENPISIAVVARDIMDRCVQLAQSRGLRLARILPEVFLCPWDGDGVALTEGHDGCLLRYGNYRGLKCNAQALPAMLQLVSRDIEVGRIRFYAGEGEESPSLEGFEVERVGLDAVRPGFVDAPVIDLQQRDYQLTSPWRNLARAWKWTAMLAAALLVAFAYNKAVALQELEGELVAIKQQQYELLAPYLPDASGPGDDLKRMLIERMRQLQANERERGFLQLMVEFTRARGAFPELQISRIGYQDNRLSFDISSSKLNDIEALLASVQKQGVDARLEALSIKPEQSSGRLVMTGGGDE
jgi:general secretion pathway protein L